jgi:hypothetical protein
MACRHKFYEFLKLDKIDFTPTTLIIGTFNPEWYKNNEARWFYGRTSKNYFWDVLPRMFNSQSLRNKNHNEWKKFCSEKRVAITDLIASIIDADAENQEHLEIINSFKDSKFADIFNEFEITNVLKIIKNNPSINKVFFTRKEGVKLFDDEIEKIQDFCRKNKIYFSYLMTPSGNARFQMRGYIPKDKKLQRSLSNFIFENWRKKF